MAKKKTDFDAGDEQYHAPVVPPDTEGAPQAGEMPPPKHGTPKTADPDGVVPRVVDPLHRAPKGSDLKRFKVRADGFGSPGTL